MPEENIGNITKSDNNFAQPFVDHRVLPDINFNGRCLIKHIPIPKKVINLCISYTPSSTIMKFKQKRYIKLLPIWIYRAN